MKSPKRNCPVAPHPLTPPNLTPKIEYMFSSEQQQQPDQPSLSDIVRQETDHGRLIVRFLIDLMQGGLEAAKPCHRLDAARQLLNLGYSPAQSFVNANAPAARPRAPRSPAAPAEPGSLHQDLAALICEETDHGRTAVRFLVDVMQGNLPDFKPHHRLSAAKELLHRGFEAQVQETEQDREAADRKRRRAEDPAGLYYRGSDGQWHRDEERSPPYGYPAGTPRPRVEAPTEPLSSPADCDCYDCCQAEDDSFDFQSCNDDDDYRRDDNGFYAMSCSPGSNAPGNEASNEPDEPEPEPDEPEPEPDEPEPELEPEPEHPPPSTGARILLDRHSWGVTDAGDRLIYPLPIIPDRSRDAARPP